MTTISPNDHDLLLIVNETMRSLQDDVRQLAVAIDGITAKLSSIPLEMQRRDARLDDITRRINEAEIRIASLLARVDASLDRIMSLERSAAKEREMQDRWRGRVKWAFGLIAAVLTAVFIEYFKRLLFP